MIVRSAFSHILIIAFIVCVPFVIVHGQEHPAKLGDIRKTFDDDESKFTNIGSIRLTISNFGTIGHGFNKWPQQPNCEYPAGSGIEHLFEGGLWVGGLKNGQGPFVTTGAVDVASVQDVAGGFEFTNAIGSKTAERSSLADGKYYSPDAISHQDFVADFTDTNTVVPGTTMQLPDHTNPLGIAVHLESYAWNFSFAENFVILNYSITNRSKSAIDSVYVGFWIDAVVRNTNISPPRGAPFFSHGGDGYVDSLKIAYEFDADGDPGFTDSYFGLKLLGTTPIQYIGKKFDGTDSVGAKAIFNSWQFRNTTDPIFFSPSDDNQRYDKMVGGLPTGQYSDLKFPSNRSLLLCTGPFRTIIPDSSVNVVFAIVCAKKYGADPTKDDTELSKKNLFQSSNFAQQAYDGEDKNRNGVLDPGEDFDGNGKITRYILPAPPRPPHVKVVPQNNTVTIYWDKYAEESIDPITGRKDFEGYRIYRTNPGKDLDPNAVLSKSFILIGEFDRADDDVFFNTGFGKVRLQKPLTFPNDPNEYWYKLVVENQLNGWQYVYSVSAFDSGDPTNNVTSLESSVLQNARRVIPGTLVNDSPSGEIGVYPNPYYAHAAWDGRNERTRKIYFYNLPSKSEIRIYTLAGDHVATLRHDASTYNGSDIQWFDTFADGTQQFAGGEHAWDLITESDQAIATGLYLFTVENLQTNEIKRGKFAIIK